jgi:hypothetical protein
MLGTTLELAASPEASATIDECCPHRAQPRNYQAGAGCACLASCAFQSLTIASVAVSRFDQRLAELVARWRLTNQGVPSFTASSPPFRPPRI